MSNDQLKRLGVRLFLKGKTIEEIALTSSSYAAKIRLNSIYHKHYQSTPKEERMIISASLEEYLSLVFPREYVIGSSLAYEGGKVSGLKQNMYKHQKAKTLKVLEMTELKKVYTDSFSDQPLMEMAKEVALIKDGIIVKQWKPKSSMSE